MRRAVKLNISSKRGSQLRRNVKQGTITCFGGYRTEHHSSRPARKILLKNPHAVGLSGIREDGCSPLGDVNFRAPWNWSRKAAVSVTHLTTPPLAMIPSIRASPNWPPVVVLILLLREMGDHVCEGAGARIKLRAADQVWVCDVPARRQMSEILFLQPRVLRHVSRVSNRYLSRAHAVFAVFPTQWLSAGSSNSRLDPWGMELNVHGLAKSGYGSTATHSKHYKATGRSRVLIHPPKRACMSITKLTRG